MTKDHFDTIRVERLNIVLFKKISFQIPDPEIIFFLREILLVCFSGCPEIFEGQIFKSM